MNPDDSAEADEALGRIRDLCQKLEARDRDDVDEVIETTGKAVEEKALRFGRGARVVCNTGRNSEEPWEAGTVVALYHRWPKTCSTSRTTRGKAASRARLC